MRKLLLCSVCGAACGRQCGRDHQRGTGWEPAPVRCSDRVHRRRDGPAGSILHRHAHLADGHRDRRSLHVHGPRRRHSSGSIPSGIRGIRRQRWAARDAPRLQPGPDAAQHGRPRVVLLNRPWLMDTYGALPEEGYLDNGRRRPRARPSRSSATAPQSLDPPFQPGVRMLGRRRSRTSTPASFVITASRRGREGREAAAASCLGDSGGPLLHGDSNLVSPSTRSATSTLHGRELRVPHRHASARAFLGQFVTLP